MKRILCVALGLIGLATFSGCCCGPQSLGCGTCGGCAQGYPAYQAGYAAPLGGSCGCGY